MSNNKTNEPSYPMKGVELLFQQPGNTPSEYLPLASIHLPTKQPRRYFDPQAMKALISSIKEKGILQPLLVRQKEDNRYELVAGERRYRAAKEAGLEEVPVVIKDLTDEDTVEISLLENLQREDLNPLEETEGILDLLSLKLNKPRESIISLLHVVSHPERESAENAVQLDDWKIITELFQSLGRFSPESFRTNRLPLLNLPKDILETLQQGKIEYTKARVIARIKDEKQRKKLLKQAIDQNLSLTQIKEHLTKLKSAEAKGKGSDTVRRDLYPQRLKDIYTKAKKVKSWDDPDKQKEFEELLERMENLL